MKIEVSNGEIVDKITILEIKLKEIKDTAKLEKVQKEFDILNAHLPSILNKSDILYTKLYEVNYKLWNIEDEIRICESKKDFGSKFIELARSVYITNDERARIKLEINKKTSSELEEVKSYAQ